MGAPEKKAEMKRLQALALRALLRDFGVRFVGMSLGDVDRLIGQAFADKEFVQHNRAFHERAFAVWLND
jgi:hypothetical protein